jgi:uncharacterized membrane protein SpoIIM required for sporulation
MESQPEAQQEQRPRSLAWQLVEKGRLAIFGITLLVELIIFFVAMVIPIGPAQQQELVRQANDLLGSTGQQTSITIFSAIFSNNIRVALIDMVPAAGAALFVASIYTTGQVIQALAISNGLPGPLFGVLLFLFPFALVELSAYAIAVASGTMLLVAWRRKTLRKELWVFVFEMVAVFVCVLVAAVMETVGIVTPLVGLSLWLPMAAAIFALAMAARGVWK